LPILMLKSLTGKRGAPGSAANQETSCARVARRPDEVANPLKTEHGVKNEKRDRRNAMSGIGSPRGDEGRHRACLGNAFFENLAGRRFLVLEVCLDVDQLLD